MPIHYCLVAKDGKVVSEHSATSGNFAVIAQRLLEKISTAIDTRKTYAYESQNFHYVVSDAIVFLCMADLSVAHRIAYAFLEDVAGRYHATFSKGGDASSFSRVLKERMEFYSYDPEADKIAAVRQQIDEVKGVMVSNIDKVLARGDQIEELVDKTDTLQYSSFQYRKQSKKLKRKMWWKNQKCCLMIVFLVVIVLISGYVTACETVDAVPCPWDSSKSTPTPMAAPTPQPHSTTLPTMMTSSTHTPNMTTTMAPSTTTTKNANVTTTTTMTTTTSATTSTMPTSAPTTSSTMPTTHNTTVPHTTTMMNTTMTSTSMNTTMSTSTSMNTTVPTTTTAANTTMTVLPSTNTTLSPTTATTNSTQSHTTI